MSKYKYRPLPCKNYDCDRTRVPGRSQLYCAECLAADTKICSRCKERKPRTEFYPQGANAASRDKRYGHCRTCVLRYRNTPEYIERLRWQRLRRRYGITREYYETMLAGQNGCCAICGRSDDAGLVVDHDHFCCPGEKSCGDCIRGLLCSLCNLKLGWVETNWPAIARHATSRLMKVAA